MEIDSNNILITDNPVFEEYSEIKQLFPDEWILLADPVLDKNFEILRAIVLFHSKDKREICYKGREKVKEFNKISVVYTGQYNIQRRIGIMKRL